METPTEQAIKDKNQTFEITDAKGRGLKLRKPGMLAQYRLVGMLGKAADSETYLCMVSPLIYLYGIDEDTSIHFASVREMEGLITRLGEEGVEAVMLGVQKYFMTSVETVEEGKEEIKK